MDGATAQNMSVCVCASCSVSACMGERAERGGRGELSQQTGTVGVGEG